MSKCEIVIKIQNLCICNDMRNDSKNDWCHIFYLLDTLETAVMQFRLLQDDIWIKKSITHRLKTQNGHLENAKEKPNPKISHKSINGFRGEQN